MRFAIKKHLRGSRSTEQDSAAKQNDKYQLMTRLHQLERRLARLEEHLRAEQDLKALLEQTRRRCTELEAKVDALTAASRRPAAKRRIPAKPSPREETERTLREFQLLAAETEEDALTLVGQQLNKIERRPRPPVNRRSDPEDLFSLDVSSIKARPAHHPNARAPRRERAGFDLNVLAPVRPQVRRKILPLSDPRSREFELSQKWVTIGRSKTNNIRVRHSSVSRKHARVREVANGFVIEDAGSTNGVFVNDERVERAALKNGDIISLGGHCELLYVEENLRS